MKYGPISDELLALALSHHAADEIDIVRMAEELTDRRSRDLSERERQIAHDALGIYSSDYNDAPHSEIDALRTKLLGGR